MQNSSSGMRAPLTLPTGHNQPASSDLRATALGAWLEGWRRVIRAPGAVATLVALTVLASSPLVSLVERRVLDTAFPTALDLQWAGRFRSAMAGIERTVALDVLGVGAPLATVRAVIRRIGAEGPVAGLWMAALAAHLLCWLGLTGAMTERLARGTPQGLRAGFGAARAHLGRLFRLWLLTGPLYLMVFVWLHPLLAAALSRGAFEGPVGPPGTVAPRVWTWVAVVLSVCAVNVVVDFARVRLVLEDRRSAVAALAAGLRFARRRPGRTAGLYAWTVLGQLVLARLWLQTQPSDTAPAWAAALLTALYVVAWALARLALLASEVVFFQGELGHARYAARPAGAAVPVASVAVLRRALPPTPLREGGGAVVPSRRQDIHS